jgi:hypothetical protein
MDVVPRPVAARASGRAMSTDRVKVRRPLILRNLGFHPFILPEYLSISGQISARRRRPVERGKPRYVTGKSFLVHLKKLATPCAMSSSQRTQVAWLFCMFTFSPDALAKRSRIDAMVSISLTQGLKKRTASSA